MKNTIKYFCLILFAILQLFCNKDNIPTKDSIAMLGFISNKKGVVVELSYAFNAYKEEDGKNTYNVGSFEFLFGINDANVIINDKKGNKLILKFIGNGKYFLDTTDIKPISNEEYKIICESSHGNVESEWVIFPSDDKVDSFKYKIDSTFEQGKLYKNVDITLSLAQSRNQNFVLSYEAEDENKLSLYNLFRLTEYNTKLNEKKGTECGRIYFSNSILFTKDCLQNDEFYEYLRLEGSNTSISNTKSVKRAIFSFSSVSQSYYNYIKNITAQEGIDIRFQEVPPSYTNIKNGIGIFYARNEGDKVFVVKP